MKQFALIGCGRIAKQHAFHIARVGRLKAVCDVIKEKADAFAVAYNAVAYSSIDDLLTNESEVDVVCICSPNGLHAEHCIKSLQASKHVLCEKPLCLTSAAVWQIIETEKFCRRKLFVVKSIRFNPVLQALKKAITENSLGQLYSFNLNYLWNRPNDYFTDWRGKLFPDGGTLYTQFSHYIDALVWLLGDVAEAKGFKTNAAHLQSIEFEDTGAIAVRMRNAIIGTLHWSVNTFRKNHEIALTILAEKGTIQIGGEYMHEIQYQQIEKDLPFSSLKNGTNNKDSMSHLHEVYDHFLTALEDENNSFAGAYDELKTVETIEKIYKALS